MGMQFATAGLHHAEPLTLNQAVAEALQKNRRRVTSADDRRMVGFIARAGIVVRNSIILVDFIELRLAQGMPLAEAVIDSGAVRFRSLLLSRATVPVLDFLSGRKRPEPVVTEVATEMREPVVV